MEFNSARPPDPGPWGLQQPKFERLVTDGPNRYFLVGTLATGEPIRVQLAAGIEPPSAD